MKSIALATIGNSLFHLLRVLGQAFSQLVGVGIDPAHDIIGVVLHNGLKFLSVLD